MTKYFSVEKFTPRFAFVECPDCKIKQRIKWSTRETECRCKGCKTEGWIKIPQNDVNTYLSKITDWDDSISYREKYISKWKKEIKIKRESAEKNNLYIPSCDEYDYCGGNYGYTSDEDEIVNEIRYCEQNIIDYEKRLDELKTELIEYKNENNNEKFYTMVMKHYSKPSQVKETLRINAEYITKDEYGRNGRFGYKCPYCNNIHGHGTWFYGINQRSTHCRMIFPNGLKHYSVEVNIDENTPVLFI